MTSKVFLSVAVLFLTTFTACNRTAKAPVTGLSDREELTVAMDIDMPGYFVINGENFGYQYDILRSYAAHLGKELKIIPGNTPSECAELIRQGKADIVAALSSHIDGMADATPVYETSYTILTRKKDARSFLAADDSALQGALEGKRLLISAGFRSSKTCDLLLDSLRLTELYVSSRTCFELIESLRDGKCDFLICEKSEAQLGCAMVKGIVPVYDFDEQMQISFLLNPEVQGLNYDFVRWLDKYRNSEEYALLNNLYFEKGIVGQLVNKPANQRVRDGISAYDKIMREVCEREGYDWRFISAIAYSESRFTEDIVSPRGAAGLLQIMPATARQFDVPQEDIFKPEVNIMLATKLLGKIESMLRFPKEVSYDDKMSIILACYNCGIGHVLDARRLAAKYGGNPNSWGDVSLFLQRKSDPQYAEDDAVKCGTFSTSGSRQTLAFVSKVMGKYNSYCAAVNR